LSFVLLLWFFIRFLGPDLSWSQAVLRLFAIYSYGTPLLHGLPLQNTLGVLAVGVLALVEASARFVPILVDSMCPARQALPLRNTDAPENCRATMARCTDRTRLIPGGHQSYTLRAGCSAMFPPGTLHVRTRGGIRSPAPKTARAWSTLPVWFSHPERMHECAQGAQTQGDRPFPASVRSQSAGPLPCSALVGRSGQQSAGKHPSEIADC